MVKMAEAVVAVSPGSGLLSHCLGGSSRAVVVIRPREVLRQLYGRLRGCGLSAALLQCVCRGGDKDGGVLEAAGERQCKEPKNIPNRASKIGLLSQE